MRLASLVCLALLLAANVSAQGVDGGGATIKGTVQDEQGGGISLANVDVTCGGNHRQFTTGLGGQFAQTGLPAATCTIMASAALFAPETVSVNLTGGDASTTLVLHVSGFLSKVQVTATRGVEEDRLSLPQGTSVTNRAQIDARPYQLLAQVLREEPGILVQQTTSGQTSPTIRGFTGQSNTYLIDGVRFNTSSWRGGPSQYTAFVDAASVDRLEIVRGPGSVQYGSDALGGTINVLTSRPAFSPGGTRLGGDVSATMGSAEKSGAGDVNLVVQQSAAAFRLGVSTRRVGDLRPGDGVDSHAAVTRFLGVSSRVIDSRLKDTSYRQSGGYLTGRIRAGSKGEISTLYMHENQTGATRYDRIYGGDGLYRSGFEPQKLDFGLVRYERRASLGFDAISGAFSVNRQADGRFEQTRPTAVLDRQQATTTAYGYQIEGQRRVSSRQQLSMGTELYDESITGAFREQVNPLTGVAAPQRPDIPDGTAYMNYGVFAQDVVDLVPGRVNMRGGLRYGRFKFSTKENPSFGVVNETVTTRAVTFQVGTVVTVTKHVYATFSVSRGFRAPNSADLGQIGLSGGGGFGITPSRAAALGGLVGSTGAADAVSTGNPIPALGPEELYAFEPGLRFKAGRVDSSITVFDLEYLDTVQRRSIVFPGNIVGSVISGYQVVRQDANGLAYIAQDTRPIGTSVNLDRSRIRGFEADGNVRIASKWTAFGYFSMSEGHLMSTGEPIRRMSPPMGGARLRWGGNRTWVEGVVTFARPQTRLNSGDLSDARIGATRTRTSIANYFNGTATDLGLVKNGILVETGENVTQVQSRLLGTAPSAPLFKEAPGFAVFGARAGIRLQSHLDLTVIGENLTDKNYRFYGSGVDAPGFNMEIRTRYRF